MDNDNPTRSKSISEVLKALQVSQLTRKKNVDCNPPVGRKGSRGQGSSEPKSVTPKDRVDDLFLVSV